MSTTKLSFRARALDAAKPMAVFMAHELPDLPDFTIINRAVPQMPTGMEKEEETVLRFLTAVKIMRKDGGKSVCRHFECLFTFGANFKCGYVYNCENLKLKLRICLRSFSHYFTHWNILLYLSLQSVLFTKLEKTIYLLFRNIICSEPLSLVW